MLPAKETIIAQLQRDILPLQGFKPTLEKMTMGLGAIERSFPNYSFPLGAVHEFICPDVEAVSATGGFIASILSKLMKNDNASIWMSSSQSIFVPALSSFGINPDKIIFIYLKNQKEILWAMEEALKCEGLAAVIGEIPELSFTFSRRLQLAVEQSRSTGFIIRNNPRKLETTACIARWQVRSLPSGLENNMPGVGFPRWNVELLKVRNGKPDFWQIEYAGGKFNYLTSIVPLQYDQTG